ncbi:MAG: hypothetical protein LiPW15_715 [Parcubacteria group bacterium LiPW_15]|nr:MAG: hypothetical protein LiPW15_715 [Parcubacteria group bacterium LiPW_15]
MKDVPRVDQDAPFGCITEGCKGVVVFQSTRLTDEAGKVTRTRPRIVSGGWLIEPYPEPNWIGRYSNPMLQAERNEYNAVPKSAICPHCRKADKFAEDIRAGVILVTETLSC